MGHLVNQTELVEREVHGRDGSGRNYSGKANDLCHEWTLLLNEWRAPDVPMLGLFCPHCQRSQLPTTSQILSPHHTSDRPIAHVTCSPGHHPAKAFRPNRTRTFDDWAEVQRRSA